MKNITKQSLWISIGSAALGLFTTFNTYQLNKYTQISQSTNEQLEIINSNINDLNSRVDNLYDIILSRQPAYQPRKEDSK